ncbi:MAG: glutamate--tRNA ligase [Gammaproteobacteria bacterium GWE2_37_16]|nr:MAG: glutamate--tRNA ligase [Gammaproteobacteria bacterium GWE2_37_16]
MTTVRTRFAPSPTGMIHLGNIRTAIYAWLYARHNNGQFVLRIEDTDLERSTQAATDMILESMDWLGLNYDEGPIYQTHRLDHYREIAEQLIEKGLAYRCYCSKERIDKLREKQMINKEKPRYDSCCREKNLPTRDEPYVIRFKNPTKGIVEFIDQVQGHLSFQNTELDDLVIIRSDRYPTYNFSVVIDDNEMCITHVIRGADHINNTPRQINLFKALDATPPTFAHLPLILGNDGKLLSKRHGAVNVMQYRDEGFLPEAMINYLIRLGWSHGDQEIFSRQEMIDLFDIKDVNKAAAAFDINKLLWLNRHYIKTLDPLYVAQYLAHQMVKLNIDITDGPDLTQIVLAQRERCETMQEMAAKSRIYYEDEYAFAEDAKKHLNLEIVPVLKALREQFNNLEDWTEEKLHEIINTVAEQFGLKLGKVAQPLRVTLTGGTFSPPIDVTLKLVGKKRTLARLVKAILFIA